MFPRRGGYMDGRSMPDMYNSRGGRGRGGLLGTFGQRDGPMSMPNTYSRGQSMSNRGYHGPPYHNQHMSHGMSGMNDGGYMGPMSMGPMNKRHAGGSDGSWDHKRSRMDRTSQFEINRQQKQNYDRHMPGKKHQGMADNRKRGGGNNAREYCSTCGKWINGCFETHKKSKEHIDKSQRKTQPVSNVKSDSTPQEKNDKPQGKVEESPKTEIAKPEPQDLNTPPKEEEKQDPVSEEPVNDPEPPKEDSESPNGNIPQPLDEEQEEKEGSVEEECAIPEYDEKVCFGREYVVPVSGYFCRLCHKFYSSETTAYETHCRSRVHYDKYSSALENLRIKRNGDSTSPVSQKPARGRGIRRGNMRP